MDISLDFIAGASIVKLKPLFSINGETVFIASKKSVYQYNTKTGKLIHEFTGCNADIIGMSFQIINSLECIVACSKTGKIIIWKITNKIELFELQIPKRNVTSFHLLSGNMTVGLQALIAYRTKKKGTKFCLINTKKLDIHTVLLKIPKTDFHIDVCQDKYFSVVVENFVHFFSLSSFTLSSYQMAKNSRKFTCVSCHPQEEAVLTGDDTGRVVFWQNLFGKKTQAIYHWHNLPVKCLAFSTLGSYFYSGANEAVLVKWQIDNPKIRQFLPRLPGGLVQLAVSDNNAYVAVATTDNAVRIIDSRMNQLTLIQHLVVGSQFECGIIYDPITRALVMNGNVGCVQFYSPIDHSLLYNVDIVGQNKLTSERECDLENTDLKKIALSRSGNWLGTVEERKDGEQLKELRLKFWFFNKEKQTYELNTSVEFPHEASISDIQFQPISSEDTLKCITIGNDKTFKMWQIAEFVTVHRRSLIWKCVSIGSFRGMLCRGLSFSLDGSLFALGFGAILTIWATENCELKSSLLHSEFKEDIRFVQFGHGRQCHLVVTASKSHLCVWNILTLTMSWVVPLSKVSLLVSDPLSPYMLVLCKVEKSRYKLCVFEPSSPNLIYSSNKLLPKSKQIVAAAFVPHAHTSDSKLQWYERSNLFLITSTNELYRLNKSGDLLFDKDGPAEDLSEEMSVFRKMKPQVQSSDVKQGIKQHLFPRDMNYKGYKEYLEAPIETLPPIRLLAESLLKSLILQREESS
ncbi:WD repeat-containing protein 75 isoform X1 [Euwallacea similis]|uniref:WD repeat-containing protein 75 isoform X1 n=2 Tax=Euwallacea similis TaxID=1736056 RepID=UPI003450755E